MIVRIFTKLNEQIVIEGFTEHVSRESIETFPFPAGCEGLTPVYLNSCGLDFNQHTGSCCDFPPTDHVDKWHLEDGVLKVDQNWDKKLMVKEVIYEKHKNRCEKLIDEELEKENPDPVVLMKLDRSMKKMRLEAVRGAIPTSYLYEEALKALDERVSGGEPDKPIVREKLLIKVQELS